MAENKISLEERTNIALDIVGAVARIGADVYVRFDIKKCEIDLYASGYSNYLGGYTFEEEKSDDRFVEDFNEFLASVQEKLEMELPLVAPIEIQKTYVTSVGTFK